jgi:hypothetical protein
MSNYNDVRVKTKEEWLKVLKNEEALGNENVIKILKYVYLSNNHMSNGKKIADCMNKEVGGINANIKSFGKRVLDL